MPEGRLHDTLRGGKNPAGCATPPPADRRSAKDTILFLDGVTVSFDGFKALNDLSLSIGKNEMRTIIGPNGAGKTTMMDVITGKTRPTRGTVLYNATIDLTRLDEATIANLGIGRKFQKPTVFEQLTVADNLELAVKADHRVFPTLFARPTPGQAGRIKMVMGLIGLGDRRATLAGALSHGQKQWLEIGMLLVQDARLLLLDEPVAGMTDHETETTAQMLLAIAGERSVVVVEHDMAFVRRLGARVTVLHEGSVLTEGSLDDVQQDQRVIETYLGR